MLQTPFGRLSLYGASKAGNIRKRLQWLALIWQIPTADLPKIKLKPTDDFIDFAEKYDVSLDWLLFGTLKGLQGMIRNRLGRQKSQPTLKERIMRGYISLSPENQRIIDEAFDRLAERGFTEPEPA
jgi:hypothetical protein